jgi:hypothetical protein
VNQTFKLFYIKNVNIDETLKLIRENSACRLKRCSGWDISETLLVGNSSNKRKIKCSSATYKYINNCGYESSPSIYKIIYSDKNVLWIDKNSQNTPQYFIQKGENIYGVSYEHKFITIYDKTDNAFSGFTVNTEEADFDNIINKCEYEKQNINEIKIDLSKFFYTGFFYKGMLFNRNWKQEITVLKNIEFTNGLLKIEIENLTYPHTGYVLLDIGENKIIEAEKY